VTGNRQTKTP